MNERVFLKDMAARFGDRFLAVVPAPSRGVPTELSSLRAKFIPGLGRVRSPAGWLQSRLVGTAVLVGAVRRFRPDLLVIRPGALPLPHYTVTKAFKIPYVLKTVGDMTFHRFYERNRLGKVIKPFNTAMARALLSGAYCIDVVSASQRDVIIGRHPELTCKVHVIDNGVDLEHFTQTTEATATPALGLGRFETVVGYVGSFPMQRGGKEVIEVVAELGSKWNLGGLIVGDSGEASACRAYAEELGVEGEVVVCGEVDYAQVPPVMSAMDIGLSILRPRERGASEQKVRQYLASGLSVVGTAGSNDFLRGLKFARVIETHSSRAVIEAVKSLLDQGPAERRTLGQAARRFAETELSVAARNTQRIRLWNGQTESGPKPWSEGLR